MTEALRGVWVYEIADLSRKAEVEDVKAFASRTHDRARPAYGHFRIDRPRRGVIWAGHDEQQRISQIPDEKPAFPVIRPIDLDSFIRDRDQLLAEAAALEEQGASIVLLKELWAAASEEQDQRITARSSNVCSLEIAG